ncbi:tRNA intron endonuclease [Spinellus fusiger]|nr:tRNA intron endonuclease [Spinellus fusiger]
MVKVEGWSYVYTPEERLRCAVYNYLWHKGLYITRGSKFGGDFLAYPGDPMRFHSHYIVEAIHRETPLTPIDIIYKGRLSTNVKKTYVLASITKEAEEAKETEEVFSFSWAGF